jgi:hypothetical protein
MVQGERMSLVGAIVCLAAGGGMATAATTLRVIGESTYTPTTPFCPGAPSAHTDPLSGFALSANGLVVGFCNSTAWTFRALNVTVPSGATTTGEASMLPVLTPTGFAQVRCAELPFLNWVGQCVAIHGAVCCIPTTWQ